MTVEPLDTTKKWLHLVWTLFGVIVLLGVTVALLVASHANDQSKAACRAYKLIAEAPLSPTTTPFGLQTSAALRDAYTRAHCDLGPLAPPDPRVAAILRVHG